MMPLQHISTHALMGWVEENNHLLMASNLKFDLALQTPDPDSQIGMMFDFSEMETSKPEGQQTSGSHPRKETEVDSASLQSGAFSVMSNFLWFFNLDSMEWNAMDQWVKWQEAGEDSESPDEDEASVSQKMEALKFFQTAVEEVVQKKMKAQEMQIQSECSQWQCQLQEQQEMMWQMQAQMQQMAKQQGFLVSDGDDISAPTST